MLFLICIIPFSLVFIVKHYYPKEMTWLELSAACLGSIIVGSCVYYTSLYSEMSDTQILSGYVTGKERDVVSCEHSYSCNCRTVRTGKTTSTRCKTCYRHSFDIDWLVKSNIKNFKISRVDSQGLLEPRRYTDAIINEPVAVQDTYTNYVKGAKDSLFNLTKYTNYTDMPEYPLNVYDYYKLDRTIVYSGINAPKKEYDTMLSEILKTLGSSKEVNIVLVLSNKDLENSLKLQTKFLGGKKNDVVIVVGTKNYPKIDWVNVFGWSKNEMLNVKLRDDIYRLGNLSANTLSPVIVNDVNKFYVRREMKDFEYLKDEIHPSMTMMIVAFIISLLCSIGLSWTFVKHEVM